MLLAHPSMKCQALKPRINIRDQWWLPICDAGQKYASALSLQVTVSDDSSKSMIGASAIARC